jgi:hypothetical protein
VFGRVVRRLQHESAQYFGAASVVIELKGYTERAFSDVFEVNVRTGICSFNAFIKLFKLEEDGLDHLERMQQRVIRDFAATTRAYNGLKAYPGLSAVRPIACFPDELAIVTEQAFGETLESLLRRQAAWQPDECALDLMSTICERIGAWIKAFQGIATDESRLSLEEMRRYIDVRLSKLVRSNRVGFTESDRERLLSYFDKCCEEVSDDDLSGVPIHADLSPGNLLVHGTDVTALDFAMAKTGTIYHDLAHLFLHIEYLNAKPWFKRRVTTQLQKALLRGFDLPQKPNQSMFRLALLQHIVCHLVQLESTHSHLFARSYNWYLQRRDRNLLKVLMSGSGLLNS